MIEEKLKDLETLIENGSVVVALAESKAFHRQLLFDKENVEPALRQRLERIMIRAFQECAADPSDTREKLVRLIQNTESFPIFEACVDALIRSEDFSTLISCRTMDIALSQDGFKKGHADYIDKLLLHATTGGTHRDVGVANMFGCEFSLSLVFAEYLQYRRMRNGSGIPSFRPLRRLQLDTGLFAAAYDLPTDRYVITLEEEDRVLGVNAKTLETEFELHSPRPGVRGIGLQADARRGFFNSEFGNVMYSFDLDSFEIIKMIEGFSLRPERIYVDPNTHTLVTGNLGLSWGDQYYMFTPKISSRGRDLGGRAVTIVDTAKEEVTDTLPAGLRPTAVGISKKYIAAGNFLENTVYIYDRRDLKKSDVVAVPLPTALDIDFELYDKHEQVKISHKKSTSSRMVEGIAIVDGRGWVLVACFDVCVLAVIDIKTRMVTDFIPVLDQPFDVVADEDETFAYVSCHKSDVVSIVDLERKQEVGRIEVGPLPVDLTLAGETLLVPDSKGLTIIDLREAKQSLGL